MATPVWPISLPQAVLVGSNDEVYEAYTLRSKMQVGPPKVRAQATKVRSIYSMQLNLSQAQVTTLKNFWTGSLSNGTLTFTWVDPLANSSTTFRFVGPVKFKNLSSATSNDGGRWTAAFSLETP